jgi:hypothetical protein
MTGYESKRAAARDKLEDDDTLTIAYRSGFHDGKKAAAQEPTKYSFRAHWEADGCIGVVAAIERLDGGVHLLKDTIDAPQPAQEPVAWLCKADENGMFGLPTADKACKDCFPVYTTPPKPAQEPWRESASDYERGFIDGMQKQMQSSVDKAVNALAQPAQEPVTWAGVDFDINTTPPQRPWVGLTAEKAAECWTTSATQTWKNIENALRMENT